MTLHDLLDEAARAEPVPVRADLAWADGRRRRRSVRARGLVAAAAVLGVLAVAVPGLPERLPTAARSAAATVDGHPERIGRQWWVRGLPDRPGPVAALLQAVDERDSYDQPDGWYAVRADGHRWRLPEVSHRTDLWPALSADGRLLGRLASPDGPYVVHDLVTGERTSFDGIVDPGGREERAGLLGSQSPAHFSPDGRLLWLPAATGRTMLLDVAAGSWRELPEGLGQPAGWAEDDRLVWLDRDGGDDAPVRARTTDLAGATVAEVELVGTAGVSPSQWGGTVRPGTGEVVLTTGAPFDSVPPAVTRYVLADGRPAAAGVPVEASTPCSTTRSAAALVVPVLPPDGAVVAVDVAGGAPSAVTVAAPQLGARCLVWAAQALDGPARGGGLVGASQDGWTWWWRELLAGALLVPLALVGLARLWRSPRRERPAGAEATPDWYA